MQLNSKENIDTLWSLEKKGLAKTIPTWQQKRITSFSLNDRIYIEFNNKHKVYFKSIEDLQEYLENPVNSFEIYYACITEVLEAMNKVLSKNRFIPKASKKQLTLDVFT